MTNLSRPFEILRRFDSPTISNVIELLNVRPPTAGYFRGSIRAIHADMEPIVGFATTATFRSAYPCADEKSYLKLPEHVRKMQELPSPRIAVIKDLDQPPAAATFGEVMCRTYRRFGCVGVITNGAARDVAQIHQLKFPIFASTVIVAHGYTRLEEIHVPVDVDGLTVRPGDILHADANGVVLIPTDIVEAVASLCEEFVSTERLVIDYLEREDATVDGFQRSVERAEHHFLDMSAKLRKRAERPGRF